MLRLLTIAVCALALGGGLAVAASSPRRDKAAALERLGTVGTTDSNTEPAAPPDSASRSIPGRMLAPGAPVPIPPSVLRIRNGWLASDGRALVAVYAGSADDDSSVGRLVVVRQDLVSGAQTVRIIDAGATGALAIAAAPHCEGECSGEIAVRTARGRELRFGLGPRETLTRSSRAAATVAPPERPRSSDQDPYPYDR